MSYDDRVALIRGLLFGGVAFVLVSPRLDTAGALAIALFVGLIGAGTTRSKREARNAKAPSREMAGAAAIAAQGVVAMDSEFLEFARRQLEAVGRPTGEITFILNGYQAAFTDPDPNAAWNRRVELTGEALRGWPPVAQKEWLATADRPWSPSPADDDRWAALPEKAKSSYLAQGELTVDAFAAGMGSAA